MSKFPNPEWIDDIKWCPTCKEPHPADREQCVYHGTPLVAAPRWRPTSTPGIHIHDDKPCCKVEIVIYKCDDCEQEKYAYYRVEDCSECGESAPEQVRRDHSICRDCKKVMSTIQY